MVTTPFQQLTAWMYEQFSSADESIERVYFSPYHPTAGIGGYLKDDFSRKPQPGMILQARRARSWLGMFCTNRRQEQAIQAGIAAGVGRNLLFAPQRIEELDELDYLASSNMPRGVQ